MVPLLGACNKPVLGLAFVGSVVARRCVCGSIGGGLYSLFGAFIWLIAWCLVGLMGGGVYSYVVVDFSLRSWLFMLMPGSLVDVWRFRCLVGCQVLRLLRGYWDVWLFGWRPACGAL